MHARDTAWRPRFVCPACQVKLEATGDGYRCPRCARQIAQREGIWRALSAEAASRLSRFLDQYRRIRESDGHRLTSREEHQRLPEAPRGSACAAEWHVRRQSFDTLLRHVVKNAPAMRVLDLGAGSAWLSHRLAAHGHHAVAVDVLDDEVDGLGVARTFPAPVTAVQADFDTLPFVARQFDLVVFNGALHYSADVATTLGHGYRMLRPGGRLVVMDSPMFRADRAGLAMLDDADRRLSEACAGEAIARPGVGYLTFERLRRAADSMRVRPRFLPSHGSVAWRIRRQWSRVRLRRAPAAFGVWVAE